MRKTILLCLSFLIFAVASPAVDLKLRNVTVEEAIAALNKAEGYSIVVNPAGLDLKKKVSVNVSGASVSRTLDLIFAGQDVSYSINGKKISVTKRHQEPQVSAVRKMHKVTGKVLDNGGSPVPGAVVMETINGAQDRNNAALTDADGSFSITIAEGSGLEVSCLGFSTERVSVGKSDAIDIVLNEDTMMLDDVVVVGYGTQKKVNLTGSVASVNVSEVTKSRPILNISNALTGMAAGVSVTSSGNKPGYDNTTVLVRGQGTLNTSSPLVIIDGMEGSFGSVNPQDVESISILKDAASAAIYGSRAANGVILITTKEGAEGQFNIDYNGYVSIQSAKKTMNLVSNYADYMEYANEAMINSNMAPYFSQESIDLWRSDNGQNPLLYPNTDWFDAIFKTGISQNHIISMNGGSKKLRTYVSLGYVDNPGVMENSGTKKYTIRANFDGQVNKYLRLGMKLNGYYQDVDIGYLDVDNVFQYLYSNSPCIVPRHPDGRFGYIQNPEDNTGNSSVLRTLYSRDGEYYRHTMTTNMYLTLTPLKGLSVTGNFRYYFWDSTQKFKPAFTDAWDFRTETIGIAGGGQTYVTNYSSRQMRKQWEILAKYDNSFVGGRLNLNVTAGTNREDYSSATTSATKYDLVDSNLLSLDAATGEAEASGSKSAWAMHSFFGRVNLNWDEKYLIEGNFRADGSSRFSKKNRWGYFPSVSAGWRISQEAFMKNSPFTNLKLRASYGSLGNNAVGNYAYLSTFSTVGYSYNSDLAVGVAQTALPNSDITWETTYVTDIGLDFGLLRSRLNGTIDIFNKTTDGILISLPAPNVHGTSSIPTTNAAQVSNKGVELTLSWNDKAGDVYYGISGNVSYIKNNVDKFKGDDYSLSGANYIKEGLPINSQYALRVDRIIQTDEDMRIVEEMIANNPKAFAAYGKPEMGDFLYKDINGDGLVDANDREVISDGPLPKWTFGLTANLEWKGIDFSILLQGQAGASSVRCSQTNGLSPVYRWGYSLNQDIMDGRWYEGRTDASWPRILEYSDTRNTINSDFYLEDLSYLKIRNIQLGYTLPQTWTRKVAMEKVRFYASLENFFTFTKYRLIDPETSSVDYPTIRQAVFGLNITF